ncbi:MAG TPA: hypothetical protein PKA05_13720 [Roseiflexaceae bacterium]|nr:hypothetical protein [Roseiflexaceae bacterium]HMP41435.1 hypothetical protein [Roseiflexaceae bacterium]
MNPAIVDGIAVILTILVLSRVAGDNPLFRVAQYLFVGTSLGLAFVIAFHQVLRPAAAGLLSGDSTRVISYAVPVVLGLLLLPRLTASSRLSWLANVPLALIFGVGAALAIGGAIIGTLAPQILASAQFGGETPAQLIGSIVLVIATILVLSSFYYTVPRDTPAGRTTAAAAAIGHWVLMVAFGFFFAGALQSYTAALAERVDFIIGWVRTLAGG